MPEHLIACKSCQMSLSPAPLQFLSNGLCIECEKKLGIAKTVIQACLFTVAIFMALFAGSALIFFTYGWIVKLVADLLSYLCVIVIVIAIVMEKRN